MSKTILFALFAITLLLTANLAGQPKIKVVQGTMLEFGDYYQGMKAERVVQVKNVGTDTLRITDVKAQCGCTATLMTNKILGPGQQGDLNITFNTEHYTGRVTKQVYLTSNDTSTPKLTISFTANILQVLTINPPYFAFEQCKADSTYSRSITITNPSQKQSIKITSVTSGSDMVKLNLLKNELMPGEQTQLQATFHPTKSGSQQGAIEINTDSPIQPKFEVRYYSWVIRK